MKKFLVIIRDVVIVWGSGMLFVFIVPQFTLRLKILMPLGIISYILAFVVISLSSEVRRFRHLALVAFLVWSLPIGKGVGLLQHIFFGIEPNISASINSSSMYFIRFLFIGLTMTLGYGLSLMVLSLKTKKNSISIKVVTMVKKKSWLIAGFIALIIFFGFPLLILINSHTSKSELDREKITLSADEDKVAMSASKPSGHAPNFTNRFGMKFMYIKPDSFMMGSPKSEKARDDDESQHKVTLTKGYYLQTTEVTQGQWQAMMGNNPASFKGCGKNCPVESVSWNDIQEFIKKLNQRDSKYQYRLPTEAEWEHAARADSESRFCFGDLDETLKEYAWFNETSGNKTHPVSVKRPNKWGLYDMHGNVDEWCHDRYGDYSSGSVTDPQGPSTSPGRVTRGGSWSGNAYFCRSASRSGLLPSYRFNDIGFRLTALLVSM